MKSFNDDKIAWVLVECINVENDSMCSTDLLPKLGTSRTIFKVNLCVELENITRGGWRPVLVLKEGALDFDLFV